MKEVSGFLLVRLIVIFISFLVNAAPVIAQNKDTADPSPYDAGARSHFKIGSNFFKQGKFEEAAKEFEEAHRLSGHPELLYNIYLFYRDGARPEKALQALRQYLASDAEIENRERLEAKLAALERQVAESKEASGKPAPSQETTDSPDVDKADLKEKQADDKGRVETEGQEATAAPSPDIDEETEPSNKIFPIALIAGGGALVISGVITGALALGEQSDLDEMCPDGICPSDLDRSKPKDIADQIKTLSVVTDVLIAGGIIAAGVGVVLFFMEGEDIEVAPDSPITTAGCSPTGCAANVTWNF